MKYFDLRVLVTSKVMLFSSPSDSTFPVFLWAMIAVLPANKNSVSNNTIVQRVSVANIPATFIQGKAKPRMKIPMTINKA